MEVLYLIRLFYRKLGIPLHKPYPRWGESPSPKTSRWPRAAQWLMKLKSCATKAGELPTSAVVLHPRKINMEPKNHLFEKGKNRPNLHFGVPCEFSRVYCCYRPSQQENSFPIIHFHVLCYFQGGYSWYSVTTLVIWKVHWGERSHLQPGLKRHSRDHCTTNPNNATTIREIPQMYLGF